VAAAATWRLARSCGGAVALQTGNPLKMCQKSIAVTRSARKWPERYRLLGELRDLAKRGG